MYIKIINKFFESTLTVLSQRKKIKVCLFVWPTATVKFRVVVIWYYFGEKSALRCRQAGEFCFSCRDGAAVWLRWRGLSVAVGMMYWQNTDNKQTAKI